MYGVTMGSGNMHPTSCQGSRMLCSLTAIARSLAVLIGPTIAINDTTNAIVVKTITLDMLITPFSKLKPSPKVLTTLYH